MEEQNSDLLTIEGIYSKLKKFMLKNFIIDLGLYPNLIKFLAEESIYLDQETIQLIEKDFREKISEILEEFGSVFVKLNYSAATDSDFLVNKLECFKLEDILILLKGSYKLNRNFENFQNKNSGLFLILKKFYNIKQENEFRLFIIENNVRGISQRHIYCYFNYDKAFIEEVKKNILDFYQKELRPIFDSFPNLCLLMCYFSKNQKN